jgi:chromatin segregation and condensation protein Rec8/ScpA/Scc1 (kleisin family)
VVTLEEMMTRLGERIEKALSTTFKEFVGSPEDKREIVVGFLAVLELVKRGLLLAEQVGKYDDIRLQYAGNPRAPKYE